MNKKTFFNMSYGVYVVTTLDGDRPTGCVANSIMQITSSPATVAVSMNHDNYTNRCMEKSGVFAFTILAEDSDPGLIGTFGFSSGRDTDKFAGVEYETVAGVPVLQAGCGYVVCRIIDRMENATHTVFLGEVLEAETRPGSAPAMTYAYYHNVIKGRSPKNAPTYVEPEEAVKPEEAAEPAAGSGPQEAAGQATAGGRNAEKAAPSRWGCSVCGYVYEGENLPADFHCPICGVGAERFHLAEN